MPKGKIVHASWKDLIFITLQSSPHQNIVRFIVARKRASTLHIVDLVGTQSMKATRGDQPLIPALKSFLALEHHVITLSIESQSILLIQGF